MGDTEEYITKEHMSVSDSSDELKDKFRAMSVATPDNAATINKEWQEMFEEFNKLQATKDNKIPKSEFEARYSIFFNPENINTFKTGSVEAEMWRIRSEEFLHRINPYCPFYVVDDYDTNKILKIFPPIFHEIDTLNTPTQNTKNKNDLPKDAEGNIMDTAYITGVVNNVFDKLGNHQLPSKRKEGAIILNKCLMNVQDEKRLLEDVKNTDILLQYFKNSTESSIDTDTQSTAPSSEDYGISFDE